MAEFDNENQDGDGSDGEDSGFGEVAVREETDGDEGSEAEEQSTGEESEATEGEQEEGQEEESKEETDKDEKPELTEKGTKKDPNPKSAVHQELANERRTRTQMEQVLANPDLLAKFMKSQYGVDVVVPTKEGEAAKEPEFKEFTAADFENLDDVAKVVNGIQKTSIEKTKSLEGQVKELTQTVQSLLQGGSAQRLYTTMSEDVASLSKEPELDPNSPDFIEGLEQDIAGMYRKLDFDEKTGVYRGEYSIAEIGRNLIATARRARAKGSQRAQTIVKNKSEGGVRTSTKVKETPGEEQSTPGQSIAKGVSKLFQ